MKLLKRIAVKLLTPLIAALASLAARYAAKKAPEIVETMLPRLREAASGAGGAAEKLPDLARSAVSSGGDLAEKLTDRAREVTGGGDSSEPSSASSRTRKFSQDQLSERSEERAKRRAERRKAMKGR